jgi:hypothetical protein
MGGSKLYSFSQALHEHKGDYAPGGSAPKTQPEQVSRLYISVMSATRTAAHVPSVPCVAFATAPTLYR